MAVSAYLISKSALVTNVAEVALAITSVRVLAIGRARVPLPRALRHPPRDVRDPGRPARLVLRRDRAARARPAWPSRRSGDLLARIVADIETLEDFYVRVIVPPIVAVLVAILAAACSSGAFDPSSASSWSAFLVVAGRRPAARRRAGPRAVRRGRSSRPAASSSAMLVDEVQGIADLIALDRAAAHRARILALGDELDRAGDRLALRPRPPPRPLAGSLAGLAGVAVLAVGVGLVGAGRLDGVYLALLPLAAVACFEVIPPLAPAFALQRRQRGRRAPAVRADRRAARRVGRSDPSRHGVAADARSAIEIRGLRFRYAPDEPVVLDGLTSSVPPGGSLAIVGPSGSGKSTLVNLLLRFWDYADGRDPDRRPRAPRDAGRRRPRDARRRAAGRPPVQCDDPRQPRGRRRRRHRRARSRPPAGWPRSTTFIETLPAGYETRDRRERPAPVSGGERQRLAIARAIIKDAPILILDEATANLDVATERRLMASLAPFIAGRTTIVISHRASVAAGMDRTIRLG